MEVWGYGLNFREKTNTLNFLTLRTRPKKTNDIDEPVRLTSSLCG